MELFNKQVHNIIEKLEYEFYIVRQVFDTRCTCFNFDTKQPQVDCKNCLGTGYRIRIKVIKGASQNTPITGVQKQSNDAIVGRMFYIKTKYEIEKDNLIFTKGKVFRIHEIQENNGLKGKESFNKTITIEKKQDSKILLKNFQELIDGKKMHKL